MARDNNLRQVTDFCHAATTRVLLFDETCGQPSTRHSAQRISPRARCSEGSMAAPPPFADPPKSPKHLLISSRLHPSTLSISQLSHKSPKCMSTSECQEKYVTTERAGEVAQDMHAGVTAVCFSAGPICGRVVGIITHLHSSPYLG